MSLFEFRTCMHFGGSNKERFIDAAYDYLDRSGFTDIARDELSIEARKHWPSSSFLGTMATLAYFSTVKVVVEDDRVVMTFGTGRSFVITLVIVAALIFAGLWWISVELRAALVIPLSLLVYGGSVFFSMLRARLVFRLIATRIS
jgi:hypothetical protein